MTKPSLAITSACAACHLSKQGAPTSPCFSIQEWPVVILTLGNDVDSGSAAACRIQHLELFLSRAEPFAMVIDARRENIARADDPVRNWLRINQHRILQFVTGTALLLSSTLGRFSMSMMLLVLRKPRPYRVFEDLDEAKAWARTTLPR